jgi:hypothetical protein
MKAIRRCATLAKTKTSRSSTPDASLTDYETVIYRVLEATDASIYVYYMGESSYLSIAAWLDGRLWLVIASFEGIMETAFVVENPKAHLERTAFQYVGKMDEVAG